MLRDIEEAGEATFQMTCKGQNIKKEENTMCENITRKFISLYTDQKISEKNNKESHSWGENNDSKGTKV